MKKILVLGLCCGVTAAFAGTAGLSSGKVASTDLSASAPTTAKPAATVDAQPSLAGDLGTPIATRPGQTPEEALYGQMKGAGQEIPTWLTEAVFGTPVNHGLRVGGETYATATPITFSPGGAYQDIATTVGAVGDYDYAVAPLTCNTSFFTSSFNGPDVVYTFTLPDYYEVTASTCNNATYDSCLGIVDEAGTLVAVNDDGAGCSSFSSLIPACCLPAGTYYLIVDAYGTGSGPYTLDVTFGASPCVVVDPCDEFVNTPVTLPYSGTGTNVGAPDVIGTDAGDVGYTFTLAAAAGVSWETCLEGTDFDTDSYLYLGDPCDGGTQLLYVDGDSGCTYASWATGYTLDCSAPLEAGTYTLVISGYSTLEGNFALTIDEISCDCPPIECVGTDEVEPNDGPNGDPVVFGSIECGETVCGTTFTDSGAGTRDTDWYELTLFGDSYVTVDVVADSFDPVIIVLASDAASILASVDDFGFCEGETLTTACLEMGTYYVFVAHAAFAGVDGGANYGVTVTCEPCTYVDPCDAATELTCTTTDEFGSNLGMPNVVGNAAGDVLYTLDIPVLSTVNIHLCSASTDYDSYLWLYDSCPTDVGAAVLYSDDDGPTCDLDTAPYEPSHIENAVLAPGSYYVVVDGYSASEGNYGITVTCEEIVCDPIECVGTAEVEPNDGPNGDPIVYGAIACGETVCGTTFTDSGAGTRDTDWYELILFEDDILTVDLDVEEFDGLLFVIAADAATILYSADNAGYCADEQIVTDCLQAGTYYLWAGPNAFAGVDGGANYGLTVACEPCVWVDPHDACQLPDGSDDAWTAGTSEVDIQSTNYLRAEQFGAAGLITAIDWTGLDLACCWSECDEDPTPFEIIFYDLSLTPVATFNADITGVPSILYAGAYQGKDYHYDLTTPVYLTAGYVSIQGGGSVDCTFLWMSSVVDGADGVSLLNTDGAGWVTDAFDLNYCLTFEAVCDAPANVAISVSGGNAHLTWDAVPGATMYHVYYALNGYGTYVWLGDSATNSYDDLGATAAGRRNYKVTADCGGAE